MPIVEGELFESKPVDFSHMNDFKSVQALFLVVCALVSGPAMAGSADGAAQGDSPRNAAKVAIEGQVVDRTHPVTEASVYAYEVASYSLKRVLTDERGRFLFKSLPAGMYKIIAYKEGFAPSISLLLRRKKDERQFLEIKMRDEQIGDVRQAEDYWSVRSQLPPDVLRDIEHLWLRDERVIEPDVTLTGVSRIGGEMLAQGGMENLGGSLGEAQLTGAEFELQGHVGAMQLGLNGQFQLLAQDHALGAQRIPDAEARSVAFALETANDAKISVTTSSGQMVNLREGEPMPVDLEHYQVQYSGRAGDRGRSDVTAQYVQEANYHQGGWADPIEIPGASRTWQLKGDYTGELTDRTSLQAGLSYRQRIGESQYLASLSGNSYGEDPLIDEKLGIYGLAGSQILPRVLVEYGLFSSVRDGSLSLMPHVGVVVDLGAKWQARTSAARRVETQDSPEPYFGFNTAFYSDDTTCRSVGEACYEVVFTFGENDETISLGAVHREYAETLRLYFSPDFFNRLESLYMVRGDELPELQFSMVRRIAPKILARLESNIASGGGGIFYATDERPYENQVRYLVTSLDTRFQQTSTGVFVAFHHLEQELRPAVDTADYTASEVEMQRLQLMLTQDLNVLADFASNWAVRFNLELSRGATPYRLTADNELYKKLTGGISVSF